MTAQRALAEMLAEVAEGALTAATSAGVRATRVEITLPVELAMRGDGALGGDLPRFVIRTAFDPPPSRIALVWEVRQ